MKTIVTSIMLIFLFTSVLGQESESVYPKIGEKIAPFQLTGAGNDGDKVITSEQLKGKFTILDFWSKYCGACIASFPKMDSLQKSFSDDLQTILIGYLDDQQRIKSVFDLHKRKNNLNLTTVYDTAVFNRFRVHGVPHLVWIDKSGIVKAVTLPQDANKENISKFIKGEDFDFEDMSFDSRKKTNFDISKPFLIKGNGGQEDNYLVRSILTKWEEGMPISGPGQITKRTKRIECLKMNIESLYHTAFFTNVNNGSPNWNFPIFETKDSLKFKGDDNLFYCYSLSSPPGFILGVQLQRIMQNELKNYFGYGARIEKRDLPCWKLVVINKQNLEEFKSKSSDKISYWDDSGGYVYNTAMENIASFIGSRLKPALNVVDATYIDFKIDMGFNIDMSDYESVRRALKRYGLDLILSSTQQNVLVITDFQDERLLSRQ
ncbi:TlpA disulfide reductase family protein [Chitinophaga sp. XS-30]|uniref:TlpA family protein disulfide reductase n=1 Tax=Chitinophaga sp. XS-30 TaxID=2604421 RepID=UPI0011DE24D7|nr:TlpA disulfide reductase family protein [Chitinophaga sp. XS-30]QEH40621.1 TlpA family protein disulfide reductase [Chitinophaga sp. XS-30]